MLYLAAVLTIALAEAASQSQCLLQQQRQLTAAAGRAQCSHNCGHVSFSERDATADTSGQSWSETVKDFRTFATSFERVSDKFTDHDYSPMYGMFLPQLKASKQQPKLLEIGLGCQMGYGPGASATLWKALLPGAQIWEAEYNAACVDQSREEGQLDGINTVTGDQGNADVVQKWLAETGGHFDVVVDDGGHHNQQIVTSFHGLWPGVRPGGLYFLEDLQVGRTAPWQDDAKEPAMSDIIQAWIEQLLIRGSKQIGVAKSVKPAALLFPLPEAVDFILCQREACVIAKTPSP